MRDTTVRSGQVFPSWRQPRRAKTSSTLECVKNGEIVSKTPPIYLVSCPFASVKTAFVL